MPEGKEEHSAGGIVFRYVDGEARFLLIRDSYKNWGFPKGHVKRAEGDDEAALREVREETGLTALTLRGDAGSIAWSFRFRGEHIHKTCHFFLIESANGETRPQAEEGITECRWLPAAAAGATLSYENARELLRAAAIKVVTGP